MPGRGTIAHLPIDQEARDALLHLYDTREPYPQDTYIQPMRRSESAERPRPFVVLHVEPRAGATMGSSTIDGLRLAELDSTGDARCRSVGTSFDAFEAAILCKTMRGHLVVVPHGCASAFALLLDSYGTALVSAGYAVIPIWRGGTIGWFRITRSKHAWTFVDPEVMTGVNIGTLLAFPDQLPIRRSLRRVLAVRVASALAAYSRWLRRAFEISIRATASMCAIAAARRYLPAREWKWAPPAYLVSLERAGFGYRAGIQYAQRYTGRSHRVDITRQYTSVLSDELPLRVGFGPAQINGRLRDGVYLCRVRCPEHIRYPLGVWDSARHRFQYAKSGTRDGYSIIHTAEMPGMRALGIQIDPTYGYVYLATFTLKRYVAKLQRILSRYGRGDPRSKACKMLGNAVYGKLAEEPKRQQLRLSKRPTSPGWYPFIDQDGSDWPNVWQRERMHYSSTQHIDIAAHITARARSDTARLWAFLNDQGANVLRVHTDSVTTQFDPRAILRVAETEIGAPRYEGETLNGSIATANVFSDDKGEHFAGATDVPTNTVRMLVDGHEVSVVQECRSLPIFGRPRTKRIRKLYRLTSNPAPPRASPLRGPPNYAPTHRHTLSTEPQPAQSR